MQRVHAADLPALARTLLSRGLAPVLLDVREPWEVAQAHFELPGVAGVTIPMQQIPARLAEIDPDRPILVLCHHGMRSLQVALFLDRQEYPDTYNIEGGIDAWSRDVDPAVPLY